MEIEIIILSSLYYLVDQNCTFYATIAASKWNSWEAMFLIRELENVHKQVCEYDREEHSHKFFSWTWQTSPHLKTANTQAQWWVCMCCLQSVLPTWLTSNLMMCCENTLQDEGEGFSGIKQHIASPSPSKCVWEPRWPRNFKKTWKAREPEFG